MAKHVTTLAFPDEDGPPDPFTTPVSEQVHDATGEMVGPVYEAEIVEEVSGAQRPGSALEVRRAGAATVRVSARVIATTRTVITHPHTKQASKLVGRHLWFPVAGTGVVLKRWRDAHGANRYERMMRHAEAAGKHDMLLEWEARDVAEKQRRHARVMDWVRSPGEVIRSAALGIASLIGLLLALGVILAIAHHDITAVTGPITSVISMIAFLFWFLSVYGAALLLSTTAAVVAFLWHTGRTHTETPAWIAPTGLDPLVRELIPDESAILAALRNLNLAVLNRKFKEGWQPRWVLATGRDGKGYRTQLELPPGVTVEMINRQKPVLAHNLVRLPVEVWPTEPKNQPGVLDLWVADQGLLTGPVEPYPLLEDGQTDYFTGVPAGVDQRGDLVIGKLMAANYAIAGTMGSGKTSLVIELLAGAMLDPIVEIEVYVMAQNVDYDPMKPRLSVLVKGDEDEHILAALTALQNLREEVTARGKLLAELGGQETKLTRSLAERDLRMRPRVVVFDECQEMFRHDKLGETAKELAIKLMMKARKVGITLLFVTPAPSADSLPRDLAKTVSHRVCFAIGDHQGNDAILGTGSHKRGITAVDLVPGEDVGTAMASGFSTRAGLLRTHHIRKDKTLDQLTPIVTRALQLREDVQTLDTTPESDTPDVEPDLLADVAAVMAAAGKELMRTQEVIAGLAARNRAAYTGYTFTKLKDGLPEAARPYKTKGTIQVNSHRVAEALAERDLYPDQPAEQETT